MNKIACLVDVETTGLNPDYDEIIEMGLLVFSYNQMDGRIINVLEKHSFLREPLSQIARENYKEAYKIHGIPFSKVKGKTFDDNLIMSIFNKVDIIIAHNASFDRSFIYRMYPEVNDMKWYCTMKYINWTEYGLKNRKLITILKKHNIANIQTHRALDDISNLFELLKLDNPNNISYLKELISHKPMRKYRPQQTPSKKEYTITINLDEIIEKKLNASKDYASADHDQNKSANELNKSIVSETKINKHARQWDNPVIRLFYSKPVILIIISLFIIINLLLSIVYGVVYFIVSSIVTFLFYKLLTNMRKEMLEYLKSKHIDK